VSAPVSLHSEISASNHPCFFYTLTNHQQLLRVTATKLNNLVAGDKRKETTQNNAEKIMHTNCGKSRQDTETARKYCNRVDRPQQNVVAGDLGRTIGFF